MRKSLSVSIALVAIMWIVYLIDYATAASLSTYGILPRKTEGLKGILFSPFLHGSLTHIVSNTLPMLILTTVLYLFYRRVAAAVLLLSALIGGGLVWIFARNTYIIDGLARDSYHIGASGVIFSLVGFLIASGIFRKNIKALLIAVIIFFLYGGVLWGVIPNQKGVSWEGHLFGCIAGVLLAYVYRGKARN